MNYQFLWDYEENLEKKIKFLLYSDKFSWDKIYLFSAYVSNPGVKKVKEILLAPSLNENTEVLIAIGTQYHFNEPSDLQEILSLSNSLKNRTTFVSFICPKTINDESHINDNFHIKAYCFLGRNRKKIKADIQIGVSIIGSSNLTKPGLEGKGELCISIHNFNLTNKLIEHLKNKYSNSPLWDQEIIEAYARGKYNKEQSRQDQDEVLQLSKENSTPVNQSEPRPGKFIKLGVTDDIALIDKGTNLVKGKEDIDWFHSYAHTTIEQAKEDFPERSLCLLLTENKILQIGEIRPYSSDQEKTEGCFVIYTKKVTDELSDDIREILDKEEYNKDKNS